MLTDPAEEWAKLTQKAIDELLELFDSQGHSGHSAYVTAIAFISKYFDKHASPAWIISKSPAIVTIGGPQKLNVIPLNQKARNLKLKVKIEGR